MKIIKRGNLVPRKFTCAICGCEFVADVNEYYAETAGNTLLYFIANCPECRSDTNISEPA